MLAELPELGREPLGMLCSALKQREGGLRTDAVLLALCSLPVNNRLLINEGLHQHLHVSWTTGLHNDIEAWAQSV